MRDWQADSIKREINFCHNTGLERLVQLEQSLEAVSNENIWNKQYNSTDIMEMRITIHKIIGAMTYCLNSMKEQAEGVIDEALELSEQVEELQSKLDECGYDEAI